MKVLILITSLVFSSLSFADAKKDRKPTAIPDFFNVTSVQECKTAFLKFGERIIVNFQLSVEKSGKSADFNSADMLNEDFLKYDVEKFCTQIMRTVKK